MRVVLAAIMVVLAALLLLVLGTGLVVLLAYGIGWLLDRFLPLTQFEATLVSLIGIAIVGAVMYQIAGAFISGPVVEDEDDDEWLFDDDWDEDDDNDEDWGDLVETQDASDSTGFVSGVPRWRQARPKPVYYDVGRNEPCPCGSGKKFKHCHGAPRS